MTTKTRIQLENVVISYANLYEAKGFNGSAPRFSANFLIAGDDSDQLNLIRETTKALLTQEFGTAIPKLKDTHLALKDGNQTSYKGYENKFYLMASNGEKFPPILVDVFNEDLSKDKNAIQSGDVVNALLDIWVQNNQYGKRVNVTLLGVQFVKKGERFTQNAVIGFKAKEIVKPEPKLAFGKAKEEVIKEIDEDIDNLFQE